MELYEVDVSEMNSALSAAVLHEVKRRFVNSSVGVYGKDANFHDREFSLCRSESVHLESEYEAERVVANSQKSRGKMVMFG